MEKQFPPAFLLKNPAEWEEQPEIEGPIRNDAVPTICHPRGKPWDEGREGTWLTRLLGLHCR